MENTVDPRVGERWLVKFPGEAPLRDLLVESRTDKTVVFSERGRVGSTARYAVSDLRFIEKIVQGEEENLLPGREFKTRKADPVRTPGNFTLPDEEVPEWECKAGGLKPLSQRLYDLQPPEIKTHYTRIPFALELQPQAWSYELATSINDGVAGGWKECVTRRKPEVPPKMIRNLRAMYFRSDSPVYRQLDVMRSALTVVRDRFFPQDQPKRDRDILWEQVNNALDYKE